MTNVVSFLGTYDGEVVSAALALIISFFVWFIKPRVKLVWGETHGFAHGVLIKEVEEKGNESERRMLVHTTSYLISNAGKKSATDVDLTFNFRPAGCDIWPVRDYEINENPDDRYIVKFKSLSPKEQVSVNILTVDIDTPRLLNVRCDEDVGKEITFFPSQKFSRPVEYFLFTLLFLGLAVAIYILIQLVGLFAALANAGI